MDYLVSDSRSIGCITIYELLFIRHAVINVLFFEVGDKMGWQQCVAKQVLIILNK